MRSICLSLALLGLFATAANGGLVHRYSFSGTAEDSVGGVHGTLVNNGSDAYYSGTSLELANSELPNSNGTALNYVDLPNGTISSISSAITLEAWVTWYGPSTSSWQRIFDFGTSDSGENQAIGGANSTYFFLTPRSGNGTFRFGYRAGAELGNPTEYTVDSSSLPVDQEVHVAIVWDDVSGQVRMFLNGQQVASGPLHFTLADMPDVNNWLGRSQWPDPAFNGCYNEFRIYDIALSEAMLSSSYQAGPDAPITTYAAPQNPTPQNGGDASGLMPVLTWQSDASADIIGHRVYLGSDARSVLTATPASTGIYQATTSVGNESFTPSEALAMDQTFYWRIEEETASGYIFSGPLWSFHTVNLSAHDPQPDSGAEGVGAMDVTLHWQSGVGATGHRIWLGESPDSLQVLQPDYPDTSYPIGDLDFGTLYYWRIDELYPSSPAVEGEVWSFRTMSKPAACLPGDLDGNCTVNFADLVLFSQSWMESISCSAFDCADFDESLLVDLADLAILARNWQQSRAPLIVINEIHYHPDENTEPVEFIELYNAGAQTIDLDGWHLDSGVTYTFGETALINPGEFVIVCQNPAAFEAKFGMAAFGPFDGKLSNEGEQLVLRDAWGNKIDEVNYQSQFPWPVAAHGEGASMELINPYLDNDLAGSWRSSGYQNSDRPELAFAAPSPGLPNQVYAEAAPPQIRQVNHTPSQPQSSDTITVTAKITDPDGVQAVALHCQLVAPGAYIPAYLPIPIASLVANPYQDQPLNPAFEDAANWLQIPMVDDGSGPDQAAGDHIYTAVIPAQVNRTLVRYRISVTDSANHTIRVPYADDESLNFACFVYDGIPAYVTTNDSVHPEGAGHAYSPELLTSLPVYTLITRSEDLYQCNGYNSADQINQGSTAPAVQDAGRAYNWEGAFVYEGKVYDHIGYRLRGGNGRYNNGAAGKRSMKFRFNRGNYFQARDIYGNKFPSEWQHLNTGKMFGNKIVWENYRKYPYGLNEVMDMLLFDIADVPSPHTYWMHFRVIDGPTETPIASGGQYNGDFWGLYVAFENYDGAFLDRLGLPKGNLYKLSDKIYDGERQLRYQGENAVADSTDYENIRWNLNHNASADFIRNHLDCDEWYRYHTVTEAIRHYDIFSDATCSNCLKNVAWYFYPDYTAGNSYFGKVQFLPFDIDDTWGPFFNYGCDHGKAAIYDQMYNDSHVLQQFTIDPEKSPLRQEYRNYIREFRDLLWQPDIIDPLILEMASKIADFVPADRDRWRLDPTPGGPIDNGPLEDGIARMQQFAWTPGTFDGRYYWVGTSNNLDNLANAEGDAENLPHTPTVSYIGAAGYPENDLRFETSPFSDPQGNETFAAMQWRIAEHAIIGAVESSEITTVTLVDRTAQWNYFKGTQEPSTPRDLWRHIGFNDEEWFTGQASIGYDDGDDNTILSDMRNNYSTLYLRKTFEITDKGNIQSLKLHVLVDDGCIIWINGTEVARLYCSGGEKYYNSVTNAPHHEATGYDDVILPAPYDYLVNGDNVIAVHGIQETFNSSDFSIDVSITADLITPLPPMPTVSANKFEINPVWESDELTTFNSQVIFPANGIKPGKTYRVRCKMKDTSGRWSHWSAPIEFVAGEALRSDLRDHLRLTELMYNNGDAEFIELKNTGTTTLDLSNVAFTSGIQFAFAGSSIQSLAPGAYVLIVKSQADFEAQYGTGLNSLIAGQFLSGSLSNSGETLKLEDTWDGTLIEFPYSDARGWPLAADGAGHALVPQSWAIEDQSMGILDYGPNWRAGTYIGGSPGADDPVTNVVVVINEFMAHTDFNDPVNYPGYDSNDWIELFNAGDSSVNLDGNWYLSDDSNELKKWALPAGLLPSGGYVSYDEITGFHQPLSAGFGLDKAGEKLFLSYLPGTGQDRVVDCIQFKGQVNSVSLGRLPDGGPYWFALDPATRNAANGNAAPHLVISELMYHPLDENEEYVELFNPTASAVALTINLPQAGIRGWVLNGGVDYEFPAGTPALAGNSRILLVGFNPYDAALLEAFQTAYDTGNLTPGVDIFGPWSGNLSNGGERLSMEKPQDSDDPLNPLAVSWIIADECTYDDDWPWPVEPDGTGSTLQRQSTAATMSGNDPANWMAANPTPGS